MPGHVNDVSYSDNFVYQTDFGFCAFKHWLLQISPYFNCTFKNSNMKHFTIPFTLEFILKKFKNHAPEKAILLLCNISSTSGSARGPAFLPLLSSTLIHQKHLSKCFTLVP